MPAAPSPAKVSIPPARPAARGPRTSSDAAERAAQRVFERPSSRSASLETSTEAAAGGSGRVPLPLSLFSLSLLFLIAAFSRTSLQCAACAWLSKVPQQRGAELSCSRILPVLAGLHGCLRRRIDVWDAWGSRRSASGVLLTLARAPAAPSTAKISIPTVRSAGRVGPRTSSDASERAAHRIFERPSSRSASLETSREAPAYAGRLAPLDLQSCQARLQELPAAALHKAAVQAKQVRPHCILSPRAVCIQLEPEAVGCAAGKRSASPAHTAAQAKSALQVIPGTPFIVLRGCWVLSAVAAPHGKTVEYCCVMASCSSCRPAAMSPSACAHCRGVCVPAHRASV